MGHLAHECARPFLCKAFKAPQKHIPRRPYIAQGREEPTHGMPQPPSFRASHDVRSPFRPCLASLRPSALWALISRSVEEVAGEEHREDTNQQQAPVQRRAVQLYREHGVVGPRLWQGLHHHRRRPEKSELRTHDLFEVCRK